MSGAASPDLLLVPSSPLCPGPSPWLQLQAPVSILHHCLGPSLSWTTSSSALALFSARLLLDSSSGLHDILRGPLHRASSVALWNSSSPCEQQDGEPLDPDCHGLWRPAHIAFACVFEMTRPELNHAGAHIVVRIKKHLHDPAQPVASYLPI